MNEKKSVTQFDKATREKNACGQATLVEIGITPRLLTREQAAAYCGVAVGAFDEWRKNGLLPNPLAGTRRWDRRRSTKLLTKPVG